MTPPDASRRSSFGAGGAVSKHGRSVTFSESSRSEKTIGLGGLYGLISFRRAESDISG